MWEDDAGYDALGGRLRELRRKAGKSQQVVADFCGLDQRTLGRYEQGRLLPGTVPLSRLCRYYKVSADWLLGLG